MGSFGPGPNFNQFLEQAWDSTYVFCGPDFSYASNVVVGSNPPYSVADFLAIYPAFGGTPLILTSSTPTTVGSAVVSGLPTTAGVLPGMVVAPAILSQGGTLVPGLFPDGTKVQSVDSNTQLTLTLPAIAVGNTVGIYNNPFVPLVVINLYIALALASLPAGRYFEAWPLVMALYVAHFCTLYLRSAGNSATTAGQLASAGLARGIQTSKSAGGVSVGIQPVTGGALEGWGHWQETEFGVQFATLANVVGGGPMFVW